MSQSGTWVTEPYCWASVPKLFMDWKTLDEAKGGDGLDTTLVWGTFDQKVGVQKGLPLLPSAARAVLSPYLPLLEGVLQASVRGAVVGLHWGGGLKDLGIAAICVPGGEQVRWCVDGEDHWLDTDGGVLCGTSTWIKEDLCHKIGVALGLWPIRKRY